MQSSQKYAFAIDGGISSLEISPTFNVGLKHSCVWHLHIQLITYKHFKKSDNSEAASDSLPISHGSIKIFLKFKKFVHNTDT